ncbi:ABC transporter permease [Paenibacillus senegalensis]|uniref:ABC transporter permease n=1 Tax=Paenibacillus senegalensis TaxID=1465766 RepID=UPI000288FAD4|nr:ABC transporter permease [Paenibacillus senegalensis]
MTIFRYSLLRSVRNKGTLLLLIAVPLLAIFMPSIDWPALPLGYHYFGVFLLFVAAKLVHLMIADRSSGVIIRISTAPVSHLSYLWQNLLAFSILLISQCVIVAASGQFVHSGQLPPVIPLLLVYSVFTFSAIAFSLAWCSFFRSRETSLAILFSVILLLAMLGGIMWPTQIMPPALQKAAMLLPTYWYMEALQLTLHKAPLWELIVPLLNLILFTLVFLLLGSRRKLY